MSHIRASIPYPIEGEIYAVAMFIRKGDILDDDVVHHDCYELDGVSTYTTIR
jgi:hypothetical protein